MSLEQALQENTAALHKVSALFEHLVANAKAFADAGATPGSVGGVAVGKTAKQAEETLFNAAEKETAEPAKKPTNVETAETAKPSTTGDVAVEYGAVRDLLLATAKTNRDGVTALLRAQGLKNLKVLLDDENDFSSVNDPAKLAAFYEALKALGE